MPRFTRRQQTLTIVKYLPAIICGILGALAQEPLNFWPFGIIFIGYLFSRLYKNINVQDKNNLISFILCWSTYSIVMCSWMRYFTVFAFLGFLALQAIISYLFFKLLMRVSNIRYSDYIFTLSFVAFELIVSHLPIISFSWLSVATMPIELNFLHNFVRAGGGALVVFVFVLFSCYLTKKILRTPKVKRKSILISTFLFTFLFTTYFVGFIGTSHSGSTYKVAIVQGNDKNRYLTQEEIDEKYLRNSHLDLAKQINNKPDLIVFPESAFNEDPSDTSNDLLKDLTPIAKKSKSLLLFNTNTDKGANYYNTNLFYSPRMNYLGQYSKKRLVPFGEYIPFKSFLGEWSILDEIGEGFSPGKKDLTIRGVTSLICFESTFSDDVRKALEDSSKLLVITTNNRSYRRSGNTEQHLAQSRLRAIEFSIPVVHASVSGKSALIDQDGNITKQSKLYERSLVEGTLDLAKNRSFYANTFDWFSYLTLVVVLCLLITNWRKRLGKK